MDKWTFNINLFDCLSDVLNLSVAKIAKKADIRQQTLSRYMLHEIRLSVQTLMQLCNALRMPVYYFVCKNGEEIFPEREEATLPAKVYRKAFWNVEEVERTFGDKPGQIFWKDAAEAMNLANQKSHRRFRLETRFPVDDFFKACTTLQISPFRFIVDPNRPEVLGISAGKQKRASRNKPSQAEVAELRQEVAALRAKIDVITNRFDDLANRYSLLLEAHKTLAHRFGVTFHSVKDSNISISADPETEYNGSKNKKTPAT